MSETDNDFTNGWKVWSKHVLLELRRLDEHNQRIENKLNEISHDVAMLKVKAGIWGIIGGAVPAFIVLALKYAAK